MCQHELSCVTGWEYICNDRVPLTYQHYWCSCLLIPILMFLFCSHWPQCHHSHPRGSSKLSPAQKDTMIPTVSRLWFEHKGGMLEGGKNCEKVHNSLESEHRPLTGARVRSKGQQNRGQTNVSTQKQTCTRLNRDYSYRYTLNYRSRLQKYLFKWCAWLGLHAINTENMTFFICCTQHYHENTYKLPSIIPVLSVNTFSIMPDCSETFVTSI